MTIYALYPRGGASAWRDRSSCSGPNRPAALVDGGTEDLR